ncbi:unnamed protein product [Phytophthora fragariaefolia]|uniref:Unnamed protein product n=1 Tax=Phytophthora fragariaefolia TaxID=1490495 RepID=A0A9W7DB70_9STRA|nr:unnamed protein product [Phytophthora fragariaefolia]
MLAVTVTTARGGRAGVPALNSNIAPVRLPNKKELGTSIPLDDDMTIMTVKGGLNTRRVQKWLGGYGDGNAPLDNEDEVQIGVEGTKDRNLMLQSLRVYRKVTISEGDCPPTTVVNIQHHIDTGGTELVLLKRRRQAQNEDEVVRMPRRCFKPELSRRATGLGGSLLFWYGRRMKQNRFCVDYRTLNEITKKGVYPLPCIDENLEAMSGALR